MTDGKPRLVLRAARLLYRLVRWLTDAAAALAALSVLLSLTLVCYSVAMRYVVDRPVAWVDEAVGYVLVASVMFAVAEALRKGEHISVDLLTERLGRRGRGIAHAVGLVAVAITAALLLVEGWQTASFSKMIGIRSIGYLDLPIWTVQVLVPIGAALLLLAAFAELLRLLVGAAAFDQDDPAGAPRRAAAPPGEP